MTYERAIAALQSRLPFTLTDIDSDFFVQAMVSAYQLGYDDGRNDA